MLRKIFFAGLAALFCASSADASVIVGLLLNPASTAGGGATSTRSGNGSWQLYAIEDTGSTDFGISSYNVVMSGTTAVNHRSPVTTITDNNGDPQTAGFSGLRSGTNANPIVASQGLPGTTPFLITGYGQTASDFITKSQAIQPTAAVVGPTTSGVWGAYNSPALNALETSTGHKWIFLAEGLGPAGLTSVTSSTITVYSNTGGTSISTPSSSVVLTETVIPEPATLSLLGLAMVGGFGFIRRRR